MAMIGNYEQTREEKELVIRRLQVLSIIIIYMYAPYTCTQAPLQQHISGLDVPLELHVYIIIKSFKNFFFKCGCFSALQEELKAQDAQQLQMRLLETKFTTVQYQLEEQQQK